MVGQGGGVGTGHVQASADMVGQGGGAVTGHVQAITGHRIETTNGQ